MKTARDRPSIQQSNRVTWCWSACKWDAASRSRNQVTPGSYTLLLHLQRPFSVTGSQPISDRLATCRFLWRMLCLRCPSWQRVHPAP